jgi:hypothetical protein
MATNTIFILIFLIVALPLIWWLMWREDFDGIQSEWRFKQDLKKRQRLSSSEFYENYYRTSGVDSELVSRLLRLFADQVSIDPGLIRPTDNYFRIYDSDATEFLEALRGGFGVSFSDRELEDIEGSFDSIVFAVHRRLKPQP